MDFKYISGELLDNLAIVYAFERRHYRFWWFGRRKDYDVGGWVENDKHLRKRIIKAQTKWGTGRPAGVTLLTWYICKVRRFIWGIVR